METVDMLAVRPCYMPKRPGAQAEYIQADLKAPVKVKVPKHIVRKVKDKDGKLAEETIPHPEYPHLVYAAKPVVEASIPKPGITHPDVDDVSEQSDVEESSTPPRRRRKSKIG